MRKKMSPGVALLLIITVYGSSNAEETALATTVDEVVVTATKTTEKVKDIPNSVIIKDFIDIEETPSRSIGEVLANEPGIDWRTYGNYGGASQEVHIRGMDGKATQVFLNGININSPSLGTADVGRLPLNSIDRIEVVKGAGSLLYGTGAMGGTVHIITKNPEKEQTSLRIKAGFGTEDTYELSAEQGTFLTDNFGYYLTATALETDGFRDNSDLEHYDVSMKLLYDNEDSFRVSLFSAYIDRDYGVPGVEPPEGTIPHVVNGTTMFNGDSASLVNQGGDEDWHNVLELTSSPMENLTLTLRAEHSDLESRNLTRYNSLGSGIETWVTNKATGIEGYSDWSPIHNLTFLIGGQYRDFDYENEQMDINDFGVGIPDSRTTFERGTSSRGGYAEMQYRPLKLIKLQAGIRHEHHSTFGSENLPRFGLVVNPANETVIKVSHGKHFRAPTMNDLFWPDDGFSMGNTNLKAETGWHSDVTLEQSFWQNKIMASLSWFKVDTDDKIDWAEDPTTLNMFGGGYWKPTNLNSFESKGWEAGITLKPDRATRVAFSYTYNDAEEEKTKGIWRDATNVPKNTFKAGLAYSWDFGLNANIVARYVDERPAIYASDTDTTPEYVLDSYWTTDIKISQSFKENWLFSLSIHNIFDKGYGTFASTFYGASFPYPFAEYPGSGRSAFASLTYEF